MNHKKILFMFIFINLITISACSRDDQYLNFLSLSSDALSLNIQFANIIKDALSENNLHTWLLAANNIDTINKDMSNLLDKVKKTSVPFKYRAKKKEFYKTHKHNLKLKKSMVDAIRSGNFRELEMLIYQLK